MCKTYNVNSETEIIEDIGVLAGLVGQQLGIGGSVVVVLLVSSALCFTAGVLASLV